METFDVVVIGAGIAGLHAARSAARRGLSVLLADRKLRLDAGMKPSSIFLGRSLSNFAVPDVCLGPPLRRVRLLGPSLSGVTLESPNDELRLGRMGRLHRHLLADAERSGVTVRLGTRYVGSEADGACTRVGLDTGGRLAIARARFLLGADGAVSSVATDLGLGENSAWIIGVEDVYAARRQEPTPRLTLVLDPRHAPGHVGWVAHDGEEIHIGVSGYADRFEPRIALEEFTERISRIEPIERALRFERRTGLIPVGGVHARIADRHGALLGDAAGVGSPLPVGGLEPTLRLGEAVVEALACHLGGHDDALDALDGSRFRPPVSGRLVMRRVLAAIRQRPVAEALILALRVPPFRAWAAQALVASGVALERRSERLPQMAAEPGRGIG